MTTSDDGVREIQLNGKQLVFLFMAVTVVSVVIFLCGVLVGRGVQARPVATEATAAPEPDADPAAEPSGPPPAAPVGPTKADDLGYNARLEASGTAPEKLVPQAEPSRTAAAPAKPAAAAPSTATAPASAAATATTPDGTKAPASAPAAAAAPEAKPVPPEPKGDGVAIQVAALRGRAEAEGVVNRLKGKGYSAYLLAPLAGQPSMYRVRVGKFKTRGEAEKVAARLEREEQFKPWITR